MRTSVESQQFGVHRFVILVFVVLLWAGVHWAGVIWNSKALLSVRYDVPTAQITIQEEPHDCDFLRAPLGVKGCSYLRRIAVTKTDTDAAGNHVVSYDDGETWSLDPQYHAKIRLTVWWQKK